MKRKLTGSLRALALEFVVYALLVTVYYFLVLHLLGDSLNQLFHTDRRVYAGAALALIIGQGILLEILTRFLLTLVMPHREEG